jgi:putative membrane protein
MNLYTWNFDLRILITLLVLTMLYQLICGPLAVRWGVSEATPQMRNRFMLAVLLLFVALVSPIDTLSLVSLSMHMIQHLILIVLVPPLIILSIPPAVASLALRNQSLLVIAQAIVHPISAFLIFNVIFVAWHVPANYDLAVRDVNTHALEHIMFTIGAILSWWPVFSKQPELPRATPGVLMLYLFFMSLPPTIIGALLTFAGYIIYPAYDAVSRPWGMSAQIDQELAGLLMWLPGGLVYFVVLTVVFFRWFNRPGDDSAV